MSSIGIFCGSANGNDPVYRKAASQVGQRLAEKGVGIVYGGGKVGLMGAVADAALQHGGSVIGVIPQSLVAREIAHTGLTHLHVVANMHERKMKMAERAEAFIALPGGAGTLEEIFEQWTWAQLGLHTKPCAFFDVNGFYRPLQDMIRQMVSNGFLKKSYEDMLLFSANISEITEYFANYHAPDVKWSR
ncbi:MAG: TIGR00730 family Rossman fold protein [Sodalis sp. (in: enterobacteria)]|uniref:LOG family protein n=1 Tax=Sodalis sp. (in: enterobacteria) TaxID=1898979 RepID=UPI0039E52A94